MSFNTCYGNAHPLMKARTNFKVRTETQRYPGSCSAACFLPTAVGNSGRYEVSMKETIVMFSHLWSLFLAIIAINLSMTPNIWMPLGNGFFSSYSATRFVLGCLITIKAILVNLVPTDTSKDTACVRFPFQIFCQVSLQALFLLPGPQAPLLLCRGLCVRFHDWHWWGNPTQAWKDGNAQNT